MRLRTGTGRRERLPGRTSRWLFLSPAGGLGLSAARLVDADPGRERVLELALCALFGALLVSGWWLDKTSFDAQGVRFGGRLRRFRWQQVRAGWTTTSPPRRGQVAFEVVGREKPFWVHDPDGRVLQAWATATGGRPGAFGYYTSDDPPPSR